ARGRSRAGVRASPPSRRGDPARGRGLGPRGAVCRAARLLAGADRRAASGGPRRRRLSRDGARALRHGPRQRPRAHRRQAVPHRPSRRFQRSHAHGHAVGSRDGPRARGRAAPAGRRRARHALPLRPGRRRDRHAEGKGAWLSRPAIHASPSSPGAKAGNCRQTDTHHERRHEMKRIITTVIATSLLTLWASAANAQQLELRFGHVGNPGSLFAASAEEFARRANEKLGDKAVVQGFGSSQLGTDTELLQKLKLGQVHFALPSTVMSSVSPEFGVFEMPYIIKDREHMKRVIDSIGESVFQAAAKANGYRSLAFWENGFRHITNNV